MLENGPKTKAKIEGRRGGATPISGRRTFGPKWSLGGRGETTIATRSARYLTRPRATSQWPGEFVYLFIYVCMHVCICLLLVVLIVIIYEYAYELLLLIIFISICVLFLVRRMKEKQS